METQNENLLLNNEWECINKKGSIYRIEKFDDGNYKYSKYFNEWVIYGRLKDKVAIMNNQENNIIIKSISEWKLTKIY